MTDFSERLRFIEAQLIIIIDQLRNDDNLYAEAHVKAMDTLTRLCDDVNSNIALDAANSLMGLFWNCGEDQLPWTLSGEEIVQVRMEQADESN